MTEPIDMNAPLPMFTPDPDELGEYSEAQPALVFDPKHGGYDDEWSRMTLSHLVAVLAALTPEQRRAVVKAARIGLDDFPELPEEESIELEPIL